MPEQNSQTRSVPESKAVPKKRTRPSLVWIVPVVAALAGAWVTVARIMSEGPTITIGMRTAEGLEAGKTKIHYNGVDIGTVTDIRLSDDHASVVATAQMAPKTEDFLVEDTRFWVVKPRVSGANVTGLGTLIKGAYIGVEIGRSKKRIHQFTALETPPVVTEDVPGRYFVLKAKELGSLNSGTPVFFRRVQVGEVTAYELDKDGRGLTVQVFVNAPYDAYVTTDSRFWEASGFDMSLSATGLTIDTESLVSILVGGIAFETPPSDPVLPPAEERSVFELHESRTAAFRKPERDPQTYVVVFDRSVRGLAVGAPVTFRGIPVGEVTDVTANMNVQTAEFSVPVTLRIDAQRFGVNILEFDSGTDPQTARHKMLDALVAHGVRAQLQTGSLLTGALYVALDFFPNAEPATIDWSQTPPRLPTIPGALQTVEADALALIKKIDQVPFEAIGNDVRKTLAELNETLASARGTVNNAGTMIAPNSALSQQLASTLEEFSRAARSMRVLADYLERHPEALLRGKSEEAK